MTIDELLTNNGLSDCHYETEEDEDNTTYTIYAPRELFAKAQRELYGYNINFNIKVKQITPTLIPALPGQVVRIYSQYESTDENSHIGIVTSAQEINGQTKYGCSYILFSLGNSYVSDVYQIHLSDGDYGGLHDGFLKIIPLEELPAILDTLIDKQHKKAVDRANALRDSTKLTAPEFIAALNKGTQVSVNKWHLDYDNIPNGVNAKGIS